MGANQSENDAPNWLQAYWLKQPGERAGGPAASRGNRAELWRNLPLAMLLPPLCYFAFHYIEAQSSLAPGAGDIWLLAIYTTSAILLVISLANSRRAADQLRVAKAALRESSEKYRSIVETSYEGIWLIDEDKVTRFVNARMAELLGYSVAEMQGQPLSRFMTAAQYEESRTRIDQRRHRLDRSQKEVKYLTREGTEIVTLTCATNMFDEAGNYAGSLAMVTDIRDRKRYEEELVDAKRFLEHSQAAGRIGSWSVDLREWEHTWSDEAYRLFGFEPGVHKASIELLLQRLHPGDIALYKAAAEAAIRGLAPFDLEYRIVLDGGEVRWIHSKGELVRDAAGQPQKLVGIRQDVTETKQIREELRESKELLEEAQQLGALGSWSLDLGSWKHTWSRQAFRMYGLEPGSVEPSYGAYLNCVHPDDYERVKQSSDAVLNEGLTQEIEYRVVWPDGSVHWIHGRSMREDDAHGKPVRLHGINIDITDRKLAEQAQAELQQQLRQAQKMEAIGTLAGGIAHDFNNILGAIQGFAELVLDDLKPGSATFDNQQEVLTAARRATELVKHILAFSRKSEVQAIPVTAALVVKEVLRLIRASLPATIEIMVEGVDSPATVLGDPVQLHQVLMNLCTNAAQEMEEQGGSLRLAVECGALGAGNPHGLAAGDYVRISVTDTGRGIAPGVLERIFDPFFTTKEVGKGTGLGLSTAHGIVTGMGGVIDVETRLGQGTRFTVVLPACCESVPGEDRQPPAAPGAGERILFVDDEAPLARMNQAILSRLGYQVSALTSSEDALEAFRRDPQAFDLIITDETMPRLTGARLAEAALAIRPDVPVILCTGYSQRITPEAAAELGIREYLLKPVSERALSQAIRQALVPPPLPVYSERAPVHA